MKLNLSNYYLIIPLIIFISFILWKPLIIFIFPGILIFYLRGFKKKDLSEILVYMIGLSLSFWICAFWTLRFIKIPFTILFYVVSAACFSYVLYYSYIKKNLNIKINYKEVIIIVIFIIVLLLYTSIMKPDCCSWRRYVNAHIYSKINL